MPQRDEVISTSFRVPAELLKRIKIQAVKEGTTASALMVEGMKRVLEARRETTRRSQ